MIKTILNGIWTFSLKKGWDWVWDQTTIDEKAIEVARQKISEIRKKNGYKVNAKKVFEIHGSRKNKSKINHISSRRQLSLFT